MSYRHADSLQTGSSQSVRANGDQPLVQRSHSRTASGPLPSHGRKPPSSRRRANTDGQPLEVHFPNNEPAQTQETLRSQIDPFNLHLTPEAGFANPSSTLKRRPTALKLLTSNLVPDSEHSHTRTAGEQASVPSRPGLRRAVTSPTHSSVDPNAHRAGEGLVVDIVGGNADLGEPIGSAGGERTPRQPITKSAPRLRRAGSDDLLKAYHQHPRLLERRRSSSTGDLVDLVAESEGGHSVGVEPDERAGIPGENNRGAGERDPGDDGTDHASDRTASESSSIISAGSSFAATDAANHTTGHLDSIPLPWSTLPASSILNTLGTPGFNDLITGCLDDMDHVNPQLLPPSHLQAAITEEVRLQTELSRLKDKHERVVSMRASLSRQLEHAIIKAELHAVQKIMSNLTKATTRRDRLVRQIYVCNDQIRQIQLQREQHRIGALQVLLYSRRSPQAPAFSHAQESAARYSIGESGTDQLSSATRPMSTATIRPTLLSSVNTPTQQNASSTSPNTGSARFSTATAISLNHFGFPLPPDRPMQIHGSSDTPSRIGAPVDHPPGTSRGLHVEVEDEPEEPLGPKVVSDAPLSPPGTANEILIYPPGHLHSTSAPLFSALQLDMPQTPWRESTLPDTVTQGGAQPSGTAPLRVKGRRSGQKGQSMMIHRPSRESTKRAKRGRESQLETVSIHPLLLLRGRPLTRPA